MKSKNLKRIALAMLALNAPFALAQSETGAQLGAARADELQRQIDVLGQEIQKLKMGETATPSAETAATSSTAQTNLGFGPGMSKVYHLSQGVSIGGYGEALWEHFNADPFGSGRRFAPGEDAPTSQSRATIERAVIYVGYKFDDHWVLNSEFEWEKGGDEVSAEFLYLDYFWKSFLNFRAGKVLIPMGLTNETHEPPTFLGALRPTLERIIIPTTWASYGLGVFGDAGPITYRSYVVTGLNATGFDYQNGAMESRSETGFANSDQYAWVGRADYTGMPGLLAGASVYLGSSSTEPVSGQDSLAIPSYIFEAHTQYNYRALDVRAMAAYSIYSRIDALDARRALAANQSIGSREGGFYLQTGYDVINYGREALIPFVRWETVDTQLEVPNGYQKNGSGLIHEAVAGVNYKPISQIVLKADYQWYFLGDHSGVNQADLAIGYVF